MLHTNKLERFSFIKNLFYINLIFAVRQRDDTKGGAPESRLQLYSKMVLVRKDLSGLNVLAYLSVASQQKKKFYNIDKSSSKFSCDSLLSQWHAL
jgi:hypothetical protein